MIARDLAQGHIDRPGGIGGVDHLANVLWEGKERDHANLVCPPRLADTGIERVPFLGKQFQILEQFIDQFASNGHFFLLIV